MNGAARSRLERLAHELASQWDVEIGAPFALSNHSYVAPAGRGAVLKIRSPGMTSPCTNKMRLRIGRATARFGSCVPTKRGGALLLERACPGTDLSTLDDVAASAIAVELGERLWRRPALPFRWIGDHVPRWLSDAAPGSAAGQRLLVRAVALYDRLEISRSTLVHGDFHQHNILDAGGRYAAIDQLAAVTSRA